MLVYVHILYAEFYASPRLQYYTSFFTWAPSFGSWPSICAQGTPKGTPRLSDRYALPEPTFPTRFLL